MFDNIIFKKCWQRHDIRYSKDVISRDVTKTSIDFFKKLINAILLVSYDAKSLFFYKSHLVKTTTVFYLKTDILSGTYRKPALLTCFFSISMPFLSSVRHHVNFYFTMPTVSTYIIFPSDWFQMDTNIVPMRYEVEFVCSRGIRAYISAFYASNWIR